MLGNSIQVAVTSLESCQMGYVGLGPWHEIADQGVSLFR